jgi:hypothetical protein
MTFETTLATSSESQSPLGLVMDAEGKNRTIEDLRTIVEKVERKAHVPSDDPDIIALWHIVESKISDFTNEDAEVGSTPASNGPERH